MDFIDIRPGDKAEQIRAYAVDEALLFLPTGTDGATLVNVAKMIEDFVKTGDTTSVITSAVEEGYSEGRFQVKEAVESWFSNVDLTDLFVTKGWQLDLTRQED